MDMILVNDLRIETIIGIEPHERTARQPVVFDFELATDGRRAAASERIEDALNYDALCRRVCAFVEASEYQLIETLAESIAALIIDEFDVPWLRLTLRKPDALPGSTVVATRIERGVRPA